MFVLGALGGCDRKPSTPPTPSAGGPVSGPTAASGGPPSDSYPAGIKPAPSGDEVAKANSHTGPAGGATAVGGMNAGQNASPPATGGTPAGTAGDGSTAPK